MKVIAPVVSAIRVLERMVPDGHLLFDHNAHDTRPDSGSLKCGTLRTRIEDFVVWANAEAAAHQLAGQIIPPDPHGRIGTQRFRRTLAWHIARRPNGLLALAIQYGHLRATLPTEGYASRSRDGIHDLIDMETALAVTDTAASLREDLEAGGGISGPAARRAIRTAAQAPRFVGTTITATTARRLFANEDAVIYDNPQSLAALPYKRSQALCQRDGPEAPPASTAAFPAAETLLAPTSTPPSCATEPKSSTNAPPTRHSPVGDRLRASAAKLRALADQHDRTRLTLQGTAR